jgi:hypothetical protein
MQDPEWLMDLANFGNTEKFKAVKKIFVETYLENIRKGMNTKDALQKAKAIAQCFLK